MTGAIIHVETIYYAMCSTCDVGTEILDHNDAMAWAQQHNTEHHHDKDQP